MSTTAEPAAVDALSKMAQQRQALEIDKYFKALVKLDGSDLHMKVGRAPMMRVKGLMTPLNRGPLTDEEMAKLCAPMLTERNAKIFEETGGADFAHTVDVDGENWRFRVNLFKQMGHIGLVARKVNNFIPDFEGLYLPPVMQQLCEYHQGMVLLAGVTGSGKSTTIGSMLNWVNRNYRKHILTIEDPIEFVYSEEKCLINQREVGVDVVDFEVAMKHAVREDPDIMLVGEMRDRETFSTAMHAAETGHLVYGTIHASTAPSTIGRILDLFPQDMHSAIRSSLAFNMKAIVAQRLLPSIKPGVSRVPVVEVLLFNSYVRKLILEERDEELPDAIRKFSGEGMQDFTMSLKSLVDKELLDREVALDNAPNRDALKMALKGIQFSGGM